MSESRVDEYADRLERWRDEFAALRAILSGTELTEAFKWDKPCYTHAGKNIVIFQPFNDRVRTHVLQGRVAERPQSLAA